MKNTKIVALVATVALLVLGAAFTSMAATYNWYQQDGEWRCKDKNGDDYYDAWAKSGADWYWLDGEGWMAREALVDEDTKYVNADGKMVKNDWKKIANDEGDEFWYYFQAGGKKLVGKDSGPKPVTVTGKKYIFNTDGQMLSGWVGVGYDGLEEDYEWKDGVYYCGDADDGAVTYGWRQIECYNEAEDFVDNNYWFFFQTNGKKFYADTTGYDEADAHLAQKKINGKWYAFDNYGVMKAEWEQAVSTASEDSTNAAAYAWFQDVEIGAKFANGWFRVVPSANFDPENNEEDTAKWFYAKSGKLYVSTIKTIAGKKYGFNDMGEMVVGLNYVTIDEDKEATFVGVDETNMGWLDDEPNCAVYYFSADEDNDGSMKTGAQTVNIDGDDYNFYFSTKNVNKGQGITEKQGNKYYYNGKKVAADDSEGEYLFYEFDEDGVVSPKDWDKFEDVDGEPVYDSKDATKLIGKNVDAAKYALISKTGAVASSGTKKDGNGWKATYKKVNKVPYWFVTLE